MEHEILLSKEQIQIRLSQLAVQIREYYTDKPWIAVIVYNGAVFFAADLLRQVDGEFKISGIQASSYNGGLESGTLSISGKVDCAGHHVLIIDDIYDTGTTLHALTEHFFESGALSVECCVLLSKEARKIKPIEIKFSAFSIQDKFVYGYGLDVENRFRNLEHIAVYKHE